MTTASAGGLSADASARSSPIYEGPGDVPADTFAVRLLLSRHHAGHLSIREAAERCGLGRGAWTNWERGAIPSDKFETAEAVAEGLGMNLIWLLRGGSLLPARGRRTKRPSAFNPGSVQWSVRPADTRPNGRPLTGSSPSQSVRRPRLIDRSQRVAVST